MTTELYANNAQTTISGAINNLATTVQLQSGAGALFPSPSTGQFFRMTLTDAATGLNREIVYCTARSGDVCTIQRAQESTTAQNWSAGDIAANLPTAGAMSNVVQQTQFQNATYIYAADNGGANVYTVAYAPAVTAITDGMVLRFKAQNANTSTSTFSPNGLTAKPIWGMNHLALSGGEIVANGDVWLQWNSSLNGGAGVWVMIASSGGNARQGRLINIQLISVTGTYTPTLGMANALVKGVGAGAGGGGVAAAGASQVAVAGGGSSGNYAEGWFSAATIGASVAVTIGAKGTGGAAGANNGNNGGTTSFGALMTIPGGTGGTGGAAATAPIVSGGGSPTSTLPTGGTLVNATGNAGSIGISTGNTSTYSGNGGGSPLFGDSGGGRAVNPNVGQNGTAPGAGGSGACTGNSGSAHAGGDGVDGAILIFEYA